MSRNNVLSFIKAKEYVIKLNLKNYRDWVIFCKSRDKPNNIPSNPDKLYKNNGWISWIDWIGKNYLGFDEAKECVNKLKLKSNSEWRILVKENNIPNNIPTSPQTFYKNKWVSWYDWLGK